MRLFKRHPLPSSGWNLPDGPTATERFDSSNRQLADAVAELERAVAKAKATFTAEPQP